MLATADDVAARLRRDLTDDEANWVDGLLEQASILVEAYCGQEFVDPVPAAVVTVVSQVAARALGNKAEGQTGYQAAAGPYSVNTTYTPDASSGGVWMTKQDRLMLRRYRIGGGVFSVDMSGGVA